MNVITELQITQWADTCSCRSKLPILLRKLILETTPKLVSYRIPGNEAVSLHGFDGIVTNKSFTLWVPEGNSIWEIGCNNNPKNKAENDYIKRTETTPKGVREESHFIFITPRRWNTKDDWIGEKQRESNWLSVKVYDSIDLESWLEEAPSTSLWLSEELGINSQGLITPEMWWLQWSSTTEPHLPLQLPIAGRDDEAIQLLNLLKDHKSKVITVIGDDKKECIAFIISTMILHNKYTLLDKTIVVTSTQSQLQSNNNQTIIIIDIDGNNDPCFGDRSNYIIIRSYPRTGQVIENAIILPIIPPDKLQLQLVNMGFSPDDAQLEIRKAGLSLPILRRRLSNDPAIKYPIWASDPSYNMVLLPCVFAGAWCDDKIMSDKIFLELLSDIDADVLEGNINAILALNDSPLVRYGNVTKVISPIDALFALGPIINKNNLDKFFELAGMVLCEKDPAFDLPNNKRYLANIIGKCHAYSSEFITGLCETLCILSVFGDNICGNRLHINISIYIDKLIKLLLMDADKERWFSLRKILRFLAEASPYAVLDCLENDLQKSEPCVQILFIPAENGICGECLRSDLLWALEILAWHKDFFLRTINILSKLSELPIKDNYLNTPIRTLKSIFCAWLPGTTLSVAEKFSALDKLSKHFRKQTLEICLYLLPSYTQQIAIENEKPKWRKPGGDIYKPTDDDIIQSGINASKLIANMFPFNKVELILIINNFSRLHLNDATHLYHHILKWSSEATDVDKSDIINYIRHQELQMIYCCANKEYYDILNDIKLCIRPSSVINRYRWLFDESNPPLPEFIKKFKSNDNLYHLKSKYLSSLRKQTIKIIQSQTDLESFVEFSLSVNYPYIIAQSILLNAPDISYVCKIINLALKHSDSSPVDSFITPLLAWIVDNDPNYLITWIVDKIASHSYLHIIAQNLPATIEGLQVASSIGDDFLSTYWHNISIFNFEHTSNEKRNNIISHLISINHPRTAYKSLICYDIKCVSADIWLSVLNAITLGGEEHVSLPDKYNLEKILSYLDISDNVLDNSIMYIEGCFIDILAPMGQVYGKRKLKIHTMMSSSPQTFFNMINGCILNSNKNKSLKSDNANIYYLILRSWNVIPGTKDDGAVDEAVFKSWVYEICRLCINEEQNELFKYFLGGLLGRFAFNQNPDNWLPQAILDFLDNINNKKARDSFHCAIINERGITIRQIYEGGIQERELAANYLNLADRYKLLFPRVSKLLLDISQDYKNSAIDYDNTAIKLQRWDK